MRLNLATIAITVLLGSSVAQAADLLPLKRGIYVPRDIPCDQRSNATVQSFWGDRLNTSHEIGKIASVTRTGGVFHLTMGMKDIDGEGEQVGHMNVRVNSKSSYQIVDVHPRQEMRWCAAAM